MGYKEVTGYDQEVYAYRLGASADKDARCPYENPWLAAEWRAGRRDHEAGVNDIELTGK